MAAAEHQRTSLVEGAADASVWFGQAPASTGRPKSKVKNRPSSRAPARRVTGIGRAACAGPGPGLNSSMPTRPAPAITPAWLQAFWNSRATPADSAMMASRAHPLHSFLAMPQTACATTATATIFSPCSAPAGMPLDADRLNANSTSISACIVIPGRHRAGPR